MRRLAAARHRPGRPALRLLAALVLLAGLLLPLAAADAADPVTMTARALVGGHTRIGAWTAVEVEVVNDGPAVSGELRLGATGQGASTYGAVADLPTGSRKRYLLYAQPSIFGHDIVVDLMVAGHSMATTKVPITVHDSYQPIVAVVAEDPGRIVPDVIAALTNPNTPSPAVVGLKPADLPSRIEAWSAIDRLIWQDTDTAQLDEGQLAALQTWLGLGGHLVILGGSTGATTLGSFPDAILPFRPTRTVDVAAADLTSLLGGTTTLTGTLPSLGGVLTEGTVMARSGDVVIAAERTIGQGSVVIIGIDAGQTGIGGSAAARALWRRVLPQTAGAVVNPLALPDDSAIVAALNNLPAVGLPPIEQLLALLIAYIVLIGPVNYLVLRRLDRREWAWLTMPVLIVLFSVGAFGLGRLLKGSDTVINEIAIVRGAAGAETGLGQIYVGVFSPSRRAFDVRVGGGALLSNPTSMQQQGVAPVPLDILLGDPAQLRGYEVGFGVLRGFRAETALPAPKIEATLVLTNGHLTGQVTNRSAAPIEAAAVLFGSSVLRLGDLAAGQTAAVDLALGSNNAFGQQLSERIFGPQIESDATRARIGQTRRTVIDQLTGYSGKFSAPSLTISGGSPMLVGWRSETPLAVDVGDEKASRVGETMYMLPLTVGISGSTIFPDELMHHTIIAATSIDAMDQGGAFSLGRGSMAVEYAPLSFGGEFRATGLSIGMSQGDPSFQPIAPGEPVGPLPAEKQPPQDDPVGSSDSAFQPPDGLPDFQLFDRGTGLWMQFAHLGPNMSIKVAEPERYVDAAGRFLVRFVDHIPEGQGSVYFLMTSKLEGTIP
jgi:hypothetical protein